MPAAMLGPADARIRQRLRAARPNQQKLAAKLGKSQSWVSKYLRDGNVIADPDDLVTIAEFLGTSIDALISESPIAVRKTATQRKGEEIADLWTRATPNVRRYVRDYLEVHVATRRKTTAR